MFIYILYFFHRYVTSGHVQQVLYNPVDEESPYCLMKTKVIPSQRLREPPHQPWVCLSKTSAAVYSAHCTCMSGLGEVCSHVGALLFKVDMAVKLGLTQKSSTSKACEWNKTFRKEVQPTPIADMDTLKGSCKKPVESVSATGTSPLPPLDVLESLQQVCPSACFFSVIPKLDEETDTASEEEDMESRLFFSFSIAIAYCRGIV